MLLLEKRESFPKSIHLAHPICATPGLESPSLIFGHPKIDIAEPDRLTIACLACHILASLCILGYIE